MNENFNNICMSRYMQFKVYMYTLVNALWVYIFTIMAVSTIYKLMQYRVTLIDSATKLSALSLFDIKYIIYTF